MRQQAASDRILGANLATGYYGGGGCAAVVQGAVTRALPGGALLSSGPVALMTLPVDMAVSADGEYIAVATAGTPGIGGVLIETPRVDDARTTVDPGPESEPPCYEPIPITLPDDHAQAIAVAFDDTGRVLVQTREPARVFRLGPYDLANVDTLALSPDSRFDTGHEQFHVAPASGITCASCHPEGGDDGHVWRFADFGVRHTPALDVGLAGTEPFHWSGDLGDFTALVDEVFVTRMSAVQPSSDRIAALEEWTTGLPAASGREMDEAALRGAELWSQLQCGSCHTGASLTNNDFAELSAHGPIQVPPLRGIALHPPYMHDGRAATLEDAVRDMIQRTRPADAMPDDDGIADLAAYLRTM
jgi:mono/diheme cytochrome c family protein